MGRLVLGMALGLLLPTTLDAQESIRLREQFPAGYQYHVSTRVELSGRLTPPPAKPAVAGAVADAVRPVTVSGQSAIEYDERVLDSAENQVRKTIRIYRRVELERKLGDEAQETGLRPGVRRLVILRSKTVEVPFSPDGPLLWGEIDLVRTDIFTPALSGLLPEQAVRVGQRWNAGAGAIQELTDLERIEGGGLECKLEELTTLAGRRHARVALAGKVSGVNEDGPSRQEIDGYFYFDLESQHLSYLSFKGVHYLLDGQGKESGRIEGRFVLTRQAHQRSADLSDQALKGVTTEPNADNTQLLYDNSELGVKLLYPRRWRVGGLRGRQLVLDEVNGSGLLLTLDPLDRTPTGAQFLAESREFLLKQQTKISRIEAPRRLQGAPQELEHFGLEIDKSGERATMDYYVIRQALGGATMAARLLPTELAAMRKDVEKIARSVTITGQQK